MPTSNSLYLVAFVLVIGIAFFIATKSRAKRIAAPPREISPEERKETDDEVLRLLASGKKIQAIKIYRQCYQTGLKEAKDAVDLLERKNV